MAEGDVPRVAGDEVPRGGERDEEDDRKPGRDEIGRGERGVGEEGREPGDAGESGRKAALLHLAVPMRPEGRKRRKRSMRI